MKQPLATVTNAAYAVAGVTAYLYADIPAPATAALCFIFLAFSSGFYHGTLTKWGQSCDEVGMYAAMSAVNINIMAKYTALNLDMAFAIFFVLYGTLSAFHLKKWVDSFVWIPVLAVPAIAIGILVHYQLAIAALLLAAVSLVLRAVGEDFLKKGEPQMHGIYHGLWHIGTAGSMYMMLML